MRVEPIISVIVPVYRAEAYIRRCLDSLVAQTFDNFEVILVDDGSPDKCGKFVMNMRHETIAFGLSIKTIVE